MHGRSAHEAAQTAQTPFKIRVFLAVEQGLTTQQVADELGISQAAASKYRMQGEALQQARRGAVQQPGS